MRIHRLPDKLPKFKKAILSVGSFDGVHDGHKYVLNQMKIWSTQVGGEVVVVTFSPHPRTVLLPDDPPVPILSSLPEKAYLLEKEGIDHLVVVPFDRSFSDQSPQTYIEEFLLGQFTPYGIIVGYDHRFGKNRKGTFELLKSYEGMHGLNEVRQLEAKANENINISSTKIRTAISTGNIRLGNAFLGHQYLLSGRIIEGLKLGRSIGFPTANIELNHSNKLIPPFGIYAAAAVLNQRRYYGMLYIGNRPVLENVNHTTIEIHLFNFSSNVYGKEIIIEVLKFIRYDKKLDNLESLKIQLREDQEIIQSYFNKLV